MKKLLLLSVLTIISLTSLSQVLVPNGALGVKFGDSGANVMAAMSENNRVFDSVNSKDDILFFTGGVFAGEELKIAGLSFFEDKLYRIIINLKTKENSSLEKIKEGLEYKYKSSPISLRGYYAWDFDKSTTILLTNDTDRGVVCVYVDANMSELKKKSENEEMAKDL